MIEIGDLTHYTARTPCKASHQIRSYYPVVLADPVLIADSPLAQ
jgi:hypothetical protein